MPDLLRPRLFLALALASLVACGSGSSRAELHAGRAPEPSFEILDLDESVVGLPLASTRLGELLFEEGAVADGELLLLRTSCSMCGEHLWERIAEGRSPDLLVLVPPAADLLEGEESDTLAALEAMRAGGVPVAQLPSREQGYVVEVPLRLCVGEGVIQGVGPPR